MQKFLLNFDGWTQTSGTSWYYSDFPEFTISETDDEISEVEMGENWVRAATNPRAWVRPMKLSYHQTVLANVNCIYYDEGRKLTPQLNLNIDSLGRGICFFYIVSGSFDFLFLQFLQKLKKEILLHEGLYDGRGSKIPVIIFSSSEEERRFSEEIRTRPVIVENRHAPNLPPNDNEISEKDRTIIAYSYAVIERLDAWRSGNGA